jgi:hypothetical protein
MVEMRNVRRIVVGNPKGKRPLRRIRYRGKDTVRMYFKYKLGGVGLINLAQDVDQLPAVVSVVMNLRVLYKAGNILTS